MMSEKDAVRLATGSGIDFQALELEIDREIDSAFIPASERRTAGDVGGPTGSFEPADRKASPTPAASSPKFDYDALVSEIDREIDSIMVAPPKISRPAPDNAPPPATPPASSGFETIESEREIDDIMNPPPITSARNAIPAESPRQDLKAGIDPFTQPAMQAEARPRIEPAASIGPLDFSEYAIHPSREDLPRLVEKFNAAYLSLDWDFSPVNIRKLQAALTSLQPYAAKCREIIPIFKVLNAVLDRLFSKPQAANSKLVELIRDSQGLIAHIILMDDNIGLDEKARVKELISRFNQMRQRALAQKAEALKRNAEAQAKAVPVEVSVEENRGEVPTEAAEEAKPAPQPEPASPRVNEAEIAPDWLESARVSLSKSITAISSQIDSLGEIESFLGKSPVLLSISERLGKVRISLQKEIDSLRQKEIEWQGMTSSGAGQTVSPESSPGQTHGQAETTSGGEPIDLTQEVSVSYVIHFGENCFALPPESIVKAELISKKKLVGILKRGFCTLADLKSLFRSIKSGILGDWEQMPIEKLKSLKFVPAGHQDVEPADFPAKNYIAVLASNGSQNGVFFAEKTEYRAVENGEIPVIDLNRLLPECPGSAPE